MTFPSLATFPGTTTFPGAGVPITLFTPQHAAAGQVSDVFTCYAYDFNTNTKLAELPISGLSFDRRLNDAGGMQGGLKLDDPAVAKAAAPVLALNQAPFALYIDRNGVIVWAGIVWTGVYTSTTRTLQLGGREFLSYFDSKVIQANYDQTTYPNGIDPAQLMFKALTDAYTAAGSVPSGWSFTGGTSSVTKYVPGYSKSQYTTVAQVLSDVTAATAPGTGGIDLVINTAWNTSGVPTTKWQITSPRAGRSASSTGLIFDLSTVVEYTWPYDATQSGNRIYAIGSGSGATQPVGKAVGPDPVGGLGQYPPLDLVVNYAQVQSGDHLKHIANGLATVYSKSVTSPTVTIPTSYQPNGLGSWLIGDDARLYIPAAAANTTGDPLFPNGLDQYWRIVAQTVSVPDSGVPTVTLTFNRPPVY